MTRSVGRVARLRRHGRGALLVGVGVPLAVAALLDVDMGRAGWSTAVFVAVSGLAVAALVARPPRARALATLAVVGSLGASVLFVIRADHDFSLLEMGALLALLGARWRAARIPGDWALVAGAVVALLVLPLRSAVTEPDVLDEYAATGLAMLGAVALAVAAGAALRSQDAQRAAAVAAVRRAERAEVARELHDVVAHHVTGIVVATQAARTAGADPASPAVDGALAAIEDSGVQALAAMRRVVGVLRADGEPPRPG